MIWRRTLVDSVYGADVVIVVSPLAEFHAWLARQYADVDTLEWRASLGKTVTHEDGPIREWTLWFPPGAPVDTIVHESLHLCAQVLRHRGVPLSRDSEEAYAYYLEAIVHQAQQAVRAATAARRARRQKSTRLRMAKASLR